MSDKIKWQAWSEYEGEECAIEVEAMFDDPGNAAEEWAEDADAEISGELFADFGSEVVVCVRKPGGADVKRYRVRAEAVTNYYADELQP